MPAHVDGPLIDIPGETDKKTTIQDKIVNLDLTSNLASTHLKMATGQTAGMNFLLKDLANASRKSLRGPRHSNRNSRTSITRASRISMARELNNSFQRASKLSIAEDNNEDGSRSRTLLKRPSALDPVLEREKSKIE